MSCKYFSENPMCITVFTLKYNVDMNDSLLLFISLITTYKSLTLHSVLNGDIVGWQLFFSYVLIEHSHDTPLPFPSLPQPPSCPSFHSQLCSAPFHSQTATKTTHSRGQAVRRHILGEERHDSIIYSYHSRGCFIQSGPTPQNTN